MTSTSTNSWRFVPNDINTYNWIQGTVGVTVAASQTSDFAGGTGTASDPYEVDTAEQLNNVRKYLDGYFIQTADISLDPISWTWKVKEGWEPIGNLEKPFTGVYDGNGYKIKELTSHIYTEYQGLFGYVGSKGILTNISLLDVKIYGTKYTGGLAGSNYGFIEKCYTTGSIQGGDLIGADGGLVGYNSGTIDRSYSTVNVDGGAYSEIVGGLVGYSSGSIDDSYATGTTFGYNMVGGLLGYNKGSVNRCYTTGFITAIMEDQPHLSFFCKYVAGVSAVNDGKITDCYYDRQTNGQSDDNGKGHPKVTKEMMNWETFKNWDFTNVWGIDSNSYPYLRWQ